jgi:hypothetical protein
MASRSQQQGVLLSRGLGLFQAGLIDQHFNTHRGRIGRLARALIEIGAPRGFGIDENTAMLVRPDGLIEVIGAGALTVLDASDAVIADGPLGVRIGGLVLSSLESGDAFEPASSTCRVHPRKALVMAGTGTGRGTGPLIDLAQNDAVKRLVIQELIKGDATSQDGLLLKFHQGFGHGYAFSFSRTEMSRGYAGYMEGAWSYTALRIRIDVRPVRLMLDESSAAVPRDLDQVREGSAQAIQAVIFRGLMSSDPWGRFHPGQFLVRADLAASLVEATGLELASDRLPAIRDVTRGTRHADEIATVVSAGLMDLMDGAFRPGAFVIRGELETALLRARGRGLNLTAIDLPRPDRNAEPAPDAGPGPIPNPNGVVLQGAEEVQRAATRAEAAAALFRFLGSPGGQP